MAENEVKLTKLAKCAGCGAKVGAGVLAQLLDGIKVHSDPDLLVGFDKSDDASVYKVSDDLALVQTVDFFPPIADDPYLFGQIAATNALSDVQIWNMDEEELLAVLNGPFYAWVGSNVTYSTTMSVSSTPTFTRTFLYKSGESYVYEECSLIARSSFPDWLQEDIW